MKQISNLFVASLALFLFIAEPALAQSIDLSPIQSLLQGIVDALTGPLGVVIATLAVLGVAALLYPVLWKAADWDPRIIDVMMTALQETPPTRNRSIHGGDSYAL
jgi:type IV secretory pathway VirB3-like protein